MPQIISSLALVMLTGLLFVGDANGDDITLTLNNPNITVIEGDPFTFSLTLSNNSDASISPVAGTPYGGIQPISSSGDLSDFYFFPPFVVPDAGGTCPTLSTQTLFAHSSCSYSITTTTPTDTGETDADAGVWGVQLGFSFMDAFGNQSFVLSNVGTVTVMDPPAVPEPSSLPLLGIALLSLMPIVRSHLTRH